MITTFFVTMHVRRCQEDFLQQCFLAPEGLLTRHVLLTCNSTTDELPQTPYNHSLPLSHCNHVGTCSTKFVKDFPRFSELKRDLKDF